MITCVPQPGHRYRLLRLLGEVGGFDVVYYTQVAGPTSLKFKDMRLDDALDATLNAYGLNGQMSEDGLTLVVMESGE